MISGYYFFLIGKESYARGMSDTALYKRFDEIAERICSTSAIVKSFKSDNISNELLESFHYAPWFREVYDKFLYREPALVIMHPHPKEFNFDEKHFFALIPFETLDNVYFSENELIRDIVALATDGSLDLIKKISESNKKKGTLQRIGDALILQPNFYGLGIDLKELHDSDKRKNTFVFHENK